MPILDPGGIRFADLLKIGVDELAFLQFGLQRKIDQIRHWHSGGWGLVIPRTMSGDLDITWGPVINTTTGRVAIETRQSWGWQAMGYGPVTALAPDGVRSTLPPYDEASCAAVDSFGQWFTHIDDRAEVSGAGRAYLSIPDDNTWYTVTVKLEKSRREEGFVSLTTGSKTWTGKGTRFTRYLAYTDDGLTLPRGTRVRIDAGDSSNGNEGTYTVDTIVSDVQMDVREAALGTTETNLPFSVPGVSPTDEDLDDYRTYCRADFTVAARTAMPDEDAGELLLWDIKRNGTDFDVLDKRASNLYQPHRFRGHALMVAPWPTKTGTSVDPYYVDRRTAGGASDNAAISDVCSRSEGGMLAVMEVATGIECREFFIQGHSADENGTWDDPAEGGTSTVADPASEPTMVDIPRTSATAPAHVCVYVVGAKLFSKRSDDNGQSWGTAVEAVDPTDVNVAHTASKPCMLYLQCGRIIVLYRHTTADRANLRWIYSDDLGESWENNGGAGFVWANVDATEYFSSPSLCQTDDGRIHTSGILTSATDVVLWYEFSISRYTLERPGGGDRPDADNGNAGSWTASGDDTYQGTSVLAEPGGSACVLVGYLADGTTNTGIAVVQFGSGPSSLLNASQRVIPTGFYRLMHAAYNAGGAGHEVRPRARMLRDGVHCVYVKGDNATPLTLHSRLMLVSQPVSGTWRAGIELG